MGTASWLIIFIGLIVALAIFGSRKRKQQRKRLEFIQRFQLPSQVRSKLLMQYPDLTEKQYADAQAGLRQYFAACLFANAAQRKKPNLGMPSKLVDELWHNFMLMTREYASFCQQAFGGFLHHAPHDETVTAKQKKLGLENTWHFAKQAANARGASPAWLLAGVPLLFLLDSQTSMANGWTWSDGQLDAFEAAHQLRMSAGSGGDGGSSGSSSDSSSGGDSGGCSGGGCGGGCS
jgi:hypothetical protein